MEVALRSPQGLDVAHRWEARRMVACVCCGHMFWSGDSKQLHLAGKDADWLRKPEEAWMLLSVDRHSIQTHIQTKLLHPLYGLRYWEV